MCFILKSVFCSTLEGQFEFKGMEGWLLKCSENAPQECHFVHPASSLSAKSHKMILTEIALDRLAPECLLPVQLEAWVLAESGHGKIYDLPNTAFIFFPRWIEAGAVHRLLSSRGNEIILRLDGMLEAKYAPIEIDLDAVRFSYGNRLTSSAKLPVLTRFKGFNRTITPRVQERESTGSLISESESDDIAHFDTPVEADMSPSDVDALLKFIQSS